MFPASVLAAWRRSAHEDKMKLRLTISSADNDLFKLIWGTENGAIDAYFVSKELVDDASK